MIPGIADGCSIVSLLNLESCRECAGAGTFGRLGEWNIICEACDGSGKVFRERAALVREE